MYDELVNQLGKSDNPSVRWKLRVGVLGEDPASRSVKRLQNEVRDGAIVQALLARRGADGRIQTRRGVYDKWHGAHWVFAALAGIGYPRGDESLVPLRDQVFEFWLGDEFYKEFVATSRQQAYARSGVPVMEGRHRRCASQQGNALFSAARLGLLDDAADSLVERLLHWQWPDGGWNCDKNPTADTSSFMETLLPMRGLVAYANERDDAKARNAAARASEVFLSRRMFKRRRDGATISAGFVELHHPVYWHYDVLAGLSAMAELGRIDDPRCADALELLERKQRRGGGWSSDARFFTPSKTMKNGADYVDWSGPRGAMNEWITVEALTVLRAADRVRIGH
jgi:hypothetical protein